jgi:hypothetical protein
MAAAASAGRGNVALRVVLLATILFAVNAWAHHHLGLGLGEFAIANTLLTFVSFSSGFLAKDQQESWKEGLQLAFSRALTLPVLAATSIAVLALTSLVSSVTIFAAGQDGEISMHLTAEGQATNEDSQRLLQGPEGSIRYWTFISPFGSSFYLQAEGYIRQPVHIPPWMGATLRVDELTRLPSVLVRVPYQHHASLKNSVLHISVAAGDDHAVELTGETAAVLLGPGTDVPEANKLNWRSELRTLSDMPESVRESIFRNWVEPHHTKSIPAPSPGQQVRVTFTTGAEKTVAQKSFTIGRSAFQDVLLITTEDKP